VAGVVTITSNTRLQVKRHRLLMLNDAVFRLLKHAKLKSI